MVQNINNPHPAPGCNRCPPTMYFQKMQFLGVFRPFLQRSLGRVSLDYSQKHVLVPKLCRILFEGASLHLIFMHSCFHEICSDKTLIPWSCENWNNTDLKRAWPQLGRLKSELSTYLLECPRLWRITKHSLQNALKSSILMAVWHFFSAAPTAQNSPRLKIHIGNVSQDTTVCWSVIPTQ